MDTRLRLTLAASLCVAPLLPLTARLAQLQVMEHRNLETRATGEFSRSTQEAAPRADILDRDGRILTQSIPVWSCFADKRMVRDAQALAARLSPLLKLPASELAGKIRGPGRFAWLKTRMSYEEARAVSAARAPGVGLVPSQERFYPNASLARSLLGAVNSEGRGAAGIELAFDRRLTGKARRLKVIRDGSGRSIYKGAEEEASSPEPLRLTIDRNVQYYAEEMLREAAAQFQVKGGLIAVEDPNNGEILAMATYPPNPLKNSIVQDSYEPGSTFKIVAAAAALEESLVRDDETLFCENGSYEIAPGVPIHDHEPSGELTLAGILERSSNIGVAKLVERVGAMRFYRLSRALGFANRTGIPLPGETAGEMKPLSDMNRVALAAAAYGYGIGVSPLQLLSAYSALANGGTLWEPQIVKDGRKPSRVRRIASPKTVETLSRMLEGVVERGTGVPAQIPGYRVAGKTGTSRRLDPLTRKYSTSQYNASFVGFLPAGKPRWTILVLIEDPKGQYYGAQVAAPVFAKLARQLLALEGIAPERPVALRLAASGSEQHRAASGNALLRGASTRSTAR